MSLLIIYTPSQSKKGNGQCGWTSWPMISVQNDAADISLANAVWRQILHPQDSGEDSAHSVVTSGSPSSIKRQTKIGRLQRRSYEQTGSVLRCRGPHDHKQPVQTDPGTRGTIRVRCICLNALTSRISLHSHKGSAKVSRSRTGATIRADHWRRSSRS